MKPLSRRSWWIALLLLLPLLWLIGRLWPDSSPLPAVHTLKADDAMLRLAAEGGFEAVVQVFPWRDIEPTRGEWHWEYPDFVVQAAEYYDLALIVRLDHPPAWAAPPAEEGAAMPANLDDYADFVGAVARRYQGRIKGYIIWNEPNLADEWGGHPPDPVAYTALLCRAYQASKAADPRAMVVIAGLAPCNNVDSQAMDDRLFLEALYQAGAGACFDTLGAHAYGFGYLPDDPRGAHQGLNLARLLDLRAVMEAHGEGSKPVWITELGWTTKGAGAHAWQTVSPQQQADYLVRAWQRIQREWPWVQVVTVWNLSQGLPPTDEMAGYSLLDENGKPKPSYGALQSELRGRWGHQLARGAKRTWASLAVPGTSLIQILAADEIVHLGDNE